MSLRVEYHELVDLDLLNAWNWYDDQERGLGDRFLDSINATVVRAQRWPKAGKPDLRSDDAQIIERKVPADGFPSEASTRSRRYPVRADRYVVRNSRGTIVS